MECARNVREAKGHVPGARERSLAVLGKLMCTVNAVIKDAPLNYASREDNGLVNEFCRKLREDFNLNIGKPGYGRIRGDQGKIGHHLATAPLFCKHLRL